SARLRDNLAAVGKIWSHWRVIRAACHCSRPSPAARRFGVGVRAWAAEKAVPAPAVFHVEKPDDGARGRTDATACPWKIPRGLISPVAWGSRISPEALACELSGNRQPGYG